MLPNISSLLNAASGASVSKIPFDGVPGNVSTWSSMMCGKSLGDHGFWELWGWDPSYYLVSKYDVDKDFPFEPFWVKLGRKGYRITVIDWPRAPLRTGKNVTQIADWIVHYRTEPTRASAPEHLAQLAAMETKEGSNRGVDAMLADGYSIEEALCSLKQYVETKSNAVSHFLTQTDWDILTVNFSEAHDVGHRFWDMHDKNHPQHNSDLTERLGDPLVDIYTALDFAVGRLCDAAGPDTTVLLYTGPGMEPNYSGNGLLDYFLMKLEGGEKHAYWARNCFELRDHPGSGAIRINVAGREQKGRIAPADLDQYCEDLTGHLLELKNIDTGTRVVKNVVRTRDHFKGERSHTLPDLYVQWNRADYIFGFESPAVGKMDFGNFRTIWTGDHSSNTLMIVSGTNGTDDSCEHIATFEEFPSFLEHFVDVDLAGHQEMRSI